MRILMVETGGGGGIGHYTHFLCSAIQNMGCCVRLLTHAHKYALDSLSKGYKVSNIFEGDAFISDWRRFYTAWKEQPADIVHFQSLFSSRRDWIMFWIVRRFYPKIRFILTVHNVLPHELLPGESITYRLSYGHAGGLILHTHASLDRLLRFMGPHFKTPTEVIPHGHYGELVRNDDMTRTAALELLSLEDKRYIVFFGAIRPYKGIDMLLRAVAAQTEWPSNLRVLIAGHLMGGITKEELLQLRDGLGILDRVTFDFRYFSEDHIPAIFKVADLVALPYRIIDQSGVLMGAIAAGIPVLCTPVGAFPEIVHSGIGFIAPKSSAEALTQTLRQALVRRALWADMGAQARIEARLYYSWNSIAKKTIRFYQDVLLH